jgi:hypothetical protein
VLGLAAAFIGGSAILVPIAADEYRDVFDRILLDPGNVALNLRYAKLAAERRELRKALAAYERVLAKDPNNPDAKAGLVRVQQLLKPNYTRVIGIFGGQYESNPLRASGRAKVEDDGVFFGRLLVNDERLVSGRRWRSSFDTFANLHVNIRSLDYGVVSLETGPIFPIGNTWQVHNFVGGAYSWYDGQTFQGRIGTGLTFEPLATSLLRSITVKGDYSFIGSGFSAQDAYVIELNARFIKIGMFTSRGIGSLTPYYRYHGVTGKGDPFFGPSGELYPLTFHQVGGRADYFYELRPNLTVNANLTLEYRHYFEEVFFETKHRRDVLVAPGAQLIVAGLFKGKADVILSYRFEYNSSNDGFLRYVNHIAGVQMLWRIR